MNILIEIECDTTEELLSHLECLKIQVKKQREINDRFSEDDDLPIGTRLEDNNCYGTHQLDVIELIKRKK